MPVCLQLDFSHFAGNIRGMVLLCVEAGSTRLPLATDLFRFREYPRSATTTQRWGMTPRARRSTNLRMIFRIQQNEGGTVGVFVFCFGDSIDFLWVMGQGGQSWRACSIWSTGLCWYREYLEVYINTVIDSKEYDHVPGEAEILCFEVL